MPLKYLCFIGLLFLLIGRFLLASLDNLNAQQPIDFAHWFLLLGALFLLPFPRLVPKSPFNTIGSLLSVIGIAAHVGMSSIDFVLWSYGNDFEGRNELIGQLINTPVIWLPFMVIGPALLYIGLGVQTYPFIRKKFLAFLLTNLGGVAVGLGQMIWNDQWVVLLGYVLFTSGLSLLLFRKESIRS